MAYCSGELAVSRTGSSGCGGDSAACACRRRWSGTISWSCSGGKRGSAKLYEQITGSSLVFTWHGAVVAALLHSAPLLMKTSRAALKSVDHKYERAARSLGASEWRLFWNVTLPLAWRSILAGAALCFARSLGDFGATLMVAGNIPGRTQTVAIAIYDAVESGNGSCGARAGAGRLRYRACHPDPREPARRRVVSTADHAGSMIQASIGKRFPAARESAAFSLDVSFQAEQGHHRTFWSEWSREDSGPRLHRRLRSTR